MQNVTNQLRRTPVSYIFCGPHVAASAQIPREWLGVRFADDAAGFAAAMAAILRFAKNRPFLFGMGCSRPRAPDIHAPKQRALHFCGVTCGISPWLACPFAVAVGRCSGSLTPRFGHCVLARLQVLVHQNVRVRPHGAEGGREA